MEDIYSASLSRGQAISSCPPPLIKLQRGPVMNGKRKRKGRGNKEEGVEEEAEWDGVGATAAEPQTLI